jgi:hypothetical protein
MVNKKSDYSGKDKFILFDAFKTLDGDSGSPVYLKVGGKWAFTRMRCTTSTLVNMNSYRITRNNGFDNDMGILLSRSFIKQGFLRNAQPKTDPDS